MSADDAYLALRGLRTLDVRLQRHQANGLAVAHWLAEQPQIARVLHPAQPSDAGHALWTRDFKGASGLFSFVFAGGAELAFGATEVLVAGRQVAAIPPLRLVGEAGIRLEF